MSRIGKKPIDVPSNVTISLDPSNRTIRVEGPKGKLEFQHVPEVSLTWDESEKQVICSLPEGRETERRCRAQWGTARARVQNMITGVTEGYQKKLQVIGVGWNFKAKGKDLELNVGYCHPVTLTPPAGVEFALENDICTISGHDKQTVGQFAANVRDKRRPEPYKGKGIRYVDEYVIRKQGKVFGK